MQKISLILILIFCDLGNITASIDKDISVLLSKAKNQKDITTVLNLIPPNSDLWWGIPVVPPIQPDEFRLLQITSRFGFRKHPITKDWSFHNGIDVQLKKGTDICAPADGIVMATGDDKFLGKYVKIRHKYGFISTLGHLDSIIVTLSKEVIMGEKIGVSGSTGRSTGAHLHYSIKKGRVDLNPIKYVYFYVKNYGR